MLKEHLRLAEEEEPEEEVDDADDELQGPTAEKRPRLDVDQPIA